MTAWTCLNGVRREYDPEQERWVKTDDNCITTFYEKVDQKEGD